MKRFLRFFSLLTIFCAVSNMLLFPLAEAQIGTDRLSSFQECDKQNSDSTKRLACKASACDQLYGTDVEQVDACKVDNAVSEEVNRAIVNNGTVSESLRNISMVNIVTFVSSIIIIMSLVYVLGYKCTSLSGIAFSLISVIDLVIYILVYSRTNIRLDELTKTLFPDRKFAGTQAGIGMTDKGVQFLTDNVMKPLIGGSSFFMGPPPKKTSDDPVLNGLQFVLQREEIMQSNYEWMRSYTGILMGMNAVAIALGIYEAAKGDVATGSGLCWSDLFLIASAFAGENDSAAPGLFGFSGGASGSSSIRGESKGGLGSSSNTQILGKTNANYKTSDLFSVMTVILLVVGNIVSMLMLKVPSIKAFFEQQKNLKKAAILRVVAGLIREGAYLLQITIYTKVIRGLRERVLALKKYSCSYMDSVNFDYNSNEYWGPVCEAAKRGTVSSLLHLNLINEAVATLAKNQSNRVFAGDVALFHPCLNKDLFYDPKCSCLKTKSCFDTNKDLLEKMPAPLAQVTSVQRTTKSLGQLMMGAKNIDQLDEVQNMKDLVNIQEARAKLYESLSRPSSSKSKSANSALLPSWASLQQKASNTLNNLFSEKNLKVLKDLDEGSKGLESSEALVSALKARGTAGSKQQVEKALELEKELYTRSASTSSLAHISNTEYEKGEADFNPDMENSSIHTKNTENKLLFEIISERYKKTFRP